MNKSELITAIAEQADMSLAKAEATVNAVVKAITGELKAGGSVSLTGFGIFQVKERAARIGRNPQTGESIEIAAAKVPAFKAGKTLKGAVS